MAATRQTLTEAEYAAVLAKALEHLRVNSAVTNREIRSLTGIGYDQAIWAFNRMLRDHKVMRVGKSSGTKYILPQPGGRP